uniref:C2 domain-containing protein n=1 Tax=Pseudo-nitzschia australis TaxID=44445 RepID=A0A7S4EG04_9STRA
MEDAYADSNDNIGNCDETVILFELVGARHLVLREEDDLVQGIDPNSIQPFCVVKYDGKRIHKTKPSEELGCDPIWTPHSSKSLFLLRTTAKEMSRSIMNISVYTKKESSLPSMLTTVTNVFMGQVHIDSMIIRSHCAEERFELNIEDELGEQTSNLGTLALRYRVATPSDIEILSMLNRESAPPLHTELVGDMITNSTSRPTEKALNLFHNRPTRPVATLVTEKDEKEIAQNSFLQSVGYIFTEQTATCPETGQTKVRVKPYPDPDRSEKTKFLRPHDLNVETRLPSSKWTEAGSGSIGKLFVEILSCDDLPNLDSGGEIIGNFTDSFCTLVYEDTCAMTDVIDDELSPRWMPWTNRAFAFNVMHPASILYLGVFDFDVLGTHDPIGRVAVNVCNLQRDTIHTITYNLYPSSNVTERKAAGTITIRVRLEWFDPRAALLATLKPRPNMHVNVSKEKSFTVVRYTCYGEHDNMEKFDMTLMRSYINEIFVYKAAVSYALSDTFTSLILWKGQVEICSVMLPLHSLILFISSTRLVEKPQLIVPYSLLGIAWMMLANLTIVRQHPSPWQSRLSFFDYLNILRTGKSSIPVKAIREYEGAEAAKAYELAWEKRVEKDRKIAEKKAELLQEINNIGDVNIHTEVSNQAFIPVDLLNRLGRYQGIVGRMCRKFRFVKIILTWEESIVSFLGEF